MARRRLTHRSPEALEAIIGITGVLGLLAGTLPGLLNGVYGLFLGGAALLFAVLEVGVATWQGRSAGMALLRVLFCGAVGFGATYGTLWYFTVYLAGQPLFGNMLGTTP